jgi:hypothetical protein
MVDFAFMTALERCPVCGHASHTRVCRFNGLALLQDMQASDLARYEYSCCHRCGVVFATRRPAGEEFEYLSRNFNEFLGRPAGEDANPLNNEHPLTDADRQEIRRGIRGGWLVSEEAQPPGADWMPWLLMDRMSQGYHFDWLSASVPLEGARVLEVRSKTGSLLDLLRRYHGAKVFAMPMFEAQKFVIETLYGIPCETHVDFEDFRIPYEGRFDLIIAKHLFTHALRPGDFFRTIRAHLSPNGYLYLHSENNDAQMYRRGKNLLGELKCFHFQSADLKVLARSLRWQGFRVVYVRHPHRGESAMTCLAQLDPEAGGEPVGSHELESRLRMYEYWHDGSVLALPEHVQRLFGDGEIEAARQRMEARRNNPDPAGPPKPARAFRLTHEQGYEVINAASGIRARPD